MLLVLPANAGSKEFMKKCLDSWLGYTTNDIIAVWGYPSEERTIAGKHLLYWNSSSSIYTLYSNTFGGVITTETCNKTIEVDNNGKIINWEWTGNSCPGSYRTGKKFVNPNNNEWSKEKLLKQQMKAEKKRLKMELKQQQNNI